MNNEEVKNYCQKESKHKCTMSLSFLRFVRSDKKYDGTDCVDCILERGKENGKPS